MPTGDYRNRPPVRDPHYSDGNGRKRPKNKERNGVQLGMMLGAFVLAVILLVVCVVMIFQAIFTKSDPATSGGQSGSGITSGSLAPSSTPSGALAGDPNDPLLLIVSDAFPADGSLARSSSELSGITVKGTVYYVDSRIYDDFTRMLADCNAVSGHTLVLTSGYRSYNYQSERYNYYYTNYKIQGLDEATAQSRAREEYLPGGRSENQTGFAVDLATATLPKNSQAFAETSEYQWLIANAQNYGFILRYAQDTEAITGMPYQPFHFRYVGVENAQAIVAAGVTLEEYVGKAPWQLEQQAASQSEVESAASA